MQAPEGAMTIKRKVQTKVFSLRKNLTQKPQSKLFFLVQTSDDKLDRFET